MNINFKPPYISFNIGDKHIFAGWCYKLEIYSDTSGEKPVTKTRKVGYHWFSGITSKQTKDVGYDKFVKNLNSTSAARSLTNKLVNDLKAINRKDPDTTLTELRDTVIKNLRL